MTAGLRALLFILAGGLTYGGSTYLFGMADGPALLLALVVGALAAIFGPHVLRGIVEVFEP